MNMLNTANKKTPNKNTKKITKKVTKPKPKVTKPKPKPKPKVTKNIAPFRIEDYSIEELFKLTKSKQPRIRSLAKKSIISIFLNKPLTGPETKAKRESRKGRVMVSLQDKDQVFDKADIIKNLPQSSLPKGVKMMPTNGYEPKFVKIWGLRKQYIEANNCYAYAANQFRFWRPHKAQPGENRLKVHNTMKYIPLDCKSITDAVLRDAGNGAYKCNDPNKACGKGLTKIMMVISPEPGGQDFHFYRQDKDGTWSHKQGWGYGPTKLDASGKVIVDPRKCNRNYGRLNYSKVCSTMCIPKHFKYNI